MSQDKTDSETDVQCSHNCQCESEEDETESWFRKSVSADVTRGDLIALYFAIILPLFVLIFIMTRRVTITM